MSGICGVVSTSPRALGKDVLASMLERLRHRGSDLVHWTDAEQGVALGEVRLASFGPPSQHSSRRLSDERGLVVLLDGGITRASGGDDSGEARGPAPGGELAAVSRAYARSGQDCVRDLDGPFTLALWDEQRRGLLLARDKLGEKALYYWVDPRGATLVFASEIKAILAHPGVPQSLDRRSLSIYLAFGYLPGSGTLFCGVRKLLPGERLWFSPPVPPHASRYWRLPRITDGFDDAAECAAHLRELFLRGLARSVNRAEEVAVFLSGGVDSTILVAGLREIGVPRLSTFTVGFRMGPGARKEEDLRHARLVAERFGTDHHEIVFEPGHRPGARLLRVVRQLDELVMTPNVYSKAVLAEAVREKGLTSVLTGSAAAGACGVHRKFLDPAKRAKLLRETERCGTDEERFFLLRSRLFDLEAQRRILVEAPEIEERDVLDVLRGYLECIESEDFFRAFLFANLTITSAEKTLRVLENAGALASLEIRSPYLDRELVECSTRIPASFDAGKTYVSLKTLMARAFERELPATVRERRVIGYPSYYWNQGELAGWQERVLAPDRLERSDLFDARGVREVLAEERGQEAKSAGKRAWALTQLALWYEDRFGELREP